MIVSHKHKFIFLKTRKTAGTSIEIFLSKFCSEDCIVTQLYEDEEKIRADIGGRPAQNFSKPWTKYTINDWAKMLTRRRLRRSLRVFNPHMHATKAKALLGDEIWNEYFKFCFERNPWSKTVSDYHWELVKEGKSDVGFESYLNKKSHTHIDWNAYTIDGSIAVDYIGRYEYLMEDMKSICDRIGIPFDKKLPRAKSFSKEKRDYKSYYNDAQIERVAQMFENEINAFGFEFGNNDSRLPFIK